MVSLIEVVNDNSVSMFKSKSFLAITENLIYFFDFLTTELKISFSLIEIQRIELEKNQILLQFQSKKFQIESETNISLIFGALLLVLRKILNSREQEKLYLKKYISVKVKNCGIGPIISLNERIRIKKLNVGDSLNPFIRAIESRSSTLELNALSKEVLSVFVEILDLCKDVKNVEIGCVDADIFQFILEKTECFEQLKSITIDGEYSESFNKLLKKLPELNLSGFGLKNCSLDEASLKSLKKFATLTNITALTLSNCFQNQVIASMFLGNQGTFFSPVIQESLVSLNLSNTKFIVPQLLFKNIRSVFFLDISNCGLELTDVFRELSYAKMRNIKAINVSSNKASAFDMSSLRIPKSLTRFVCDDIRWKNNSLLVLLRLLANRIGVDLQLSLNNAAMENEQWSSLFEFLMKLSIPDLTELSWNNNRVEKQLFYFLENTRIEKLSLKQCFTSDLDSLNDFIKSSNLVELSINGSVGSNISLLLDAVAASGITKLDISNNELKNEGVEALSSLENANLEWLKIDNCGVTRGEVLQNVMNKCPFILPPLTDLEHFPTLKKKLMRKCPAQSEPFDPRYKLPQYSLYLEPFGFVLPCEEPFAKTFYTREEIKELKRMSLDVDARSMKSTRMAMSVFIPHEKLKQENATRDMQSLNPRLMMRNDLSFASAVKTAKRREAKNYDDVNSYKLSKREEMDLMKKPKNDNRSRIPSIEDASSTFGVFPEKKTRRRNDTASVRFDKKYISGH